MGFGVKPQDLTGVRGVLVPGGHRSGPTEAAAETRSPCLPIHKKGGDECPPLGTAQNPLPPGLRNGNDEMRQKARFYARCALHHMMQSGPKTLRTSSCDEVRKTQVFPSFFSALNHFVISSRAGISSRAKGKAARTGHGPKRGPLASRPQKTPPPQSGGLGCRLGRS